MADRERLNPDADTGTHTGNGSMPAGETRAGEVGGALALNPDRDAILLSLMRHSNADELVLRDWVRRANMDMLPYQGQWRPRRDVERLRRQKKRRSWLILVEVMIGIAAVAAANVVFFAILARMFA